MQVAPERLKAFLLDAGLITEDKFSEAQKKSKKTNQKIRNVLIADGLITEEKLTKLEAYILGIAFVNLEQEQENILPEVLRIIPEPIARSHNIIAFRKLGNNLEVAMTDPEDLGAIELIKKKTNFRILPRLATEEGIKIVLKQYGKSLEAEFGDIIKRDVGDIKTISDIDTKIGKDTEDLRKVAEEIPIIRIVDTLTKHAILQRASDIHVEPTEKEVVVRYRIDGVLHDAMILPKTVSDGIVARIKVLSNLKLDEHRLPQDGRFKIETAEYKYSIRVSILPTFDGEKIVMRLLPETSKAISLESLGFNGKSLDMVKTNLKKPVGMILVTGPTGSGKTTTLYAMMEILNVPGVNISTVEDPIEYRMPRINQTQVSPKIGLTFANGLRALLRQDPNIIMVGEIRDNETASLAINAALTGHLVLSTLHTNDAAGAIPRLIDMQVEPFLISSTLNVIMAQRLVRRLSKEKEKYKLKKEEIKNLEKYCDTNKVLEILKKENFIKEASKLEDVDFYRPKGGKNIESGYEGRIGIYEILSVNETIKDMIIKKATSDHIQEQAKKDGMITMIEDGFVKAAQGITSVEEVLRVITE